MGDPFDPADLPLVPFCHSMQPLTVCVDLGGPWVVVYLSTRRKPRSKGTARIGLMKTYLSGASYVPLIGLLSGQLLAISASAASPVRNDFRLGQQTDKQSQEADTRPSSKPYTPDPEAQELYLKGRELLGNAARLQDSESSKQTLEKAVEYFGQAVAKDPNYATAYIALAESYLFLQGFGGAAGKDVIPKVKSALVRALAIDEKQAEAHQLLAQAMFWFDWDWSGAEREFRRARELNPNIRGSFFANYAALLAASGRFDDALAEVKRINDLDPDPGRANFGLGFILYWARRHDEAIEHYWKPIEANPQARISHFYLGFAYVQKSRFQDALAEFEKAAADRNAGAVAALGYGYAAAGNKERAMAILKELEDGYKHRFVHFPTGVPPYRVAAIYAALGDKNRALEWLERDYEARGGWMIWLKVDPAFDNLRSEPRFQELLRRMNFPE